MTTFIIARAAFRQCTAHHSTSYLLLATATAGAVNKRPQYGQPSIKPRHALYTAQHADISHTSRHRSRWRQKLQGSHITSLNLLRAPICSRKSTRPKELQMLPKLHT